VLFRSGISDVTPLKDLPNLKYLRLTYNNIVDLAPLVNGSSLGGGDMLYITGNPLSDEAINVQIPALEARGVTIYN
jgi:Leucine-rich repeat (LRR) protein